MSDEKHVDEKHVDFGSSSVVSPAADAKKAALPKAPQVKPKDVTLSEPILQKVNMFFKKLDSDGNGSISREEALAFWKKNFARLNASAMFKEVDQDGNGGGGAFAFAVGFAPPMKLNRFGFGFGAAMTRREASLSESVVRSSVSHLTTTSSAPSSTTVPRYTP